MMSNEIKALDYVEQLIVNSNGLGSASHIEFSNWKLQFILLQQKVDTLPGLSPTEEYERKRALEALNKFSLRFAKTSLPDVIAKQNAESNDPSAIDWQSKLERNKKMNDSPVRILFLAANPSNTDPLRLDQEVRTIDERLQSSKHRDRFQIHQHWAVRVSDLQELLLRHKPHIVHFSGHGSKSGRIVLEDEIGSATTVPSDALGNLFRILKKDVRCVVLNACFSLTQADAIADEIDCVIGMSQAIGDESAIQFAGSFYQGLGYGENIGVAFELGCNAIDLSGLGEEDKPKLLARKDVKADNIILSNREDL